jgi:hypothetical protein
MADSRQGSDGVPLSLKVAAAAKTASAVLAATAVGGPLAGVAVAVGAAALYYGVKAKCDEVIREIESRPK